MIVQGEIARTKVEARNRTDKPLRVSFVSTCDCLSVSPSFRLLAPGEIGSFDLPSIPRTIRGSLPVDL